MSFSNKIQCTIGGHREVSVVGVHIALAEDDSGASYAPERSPMATVIATDVIFAPNTHYT